VALEGESVGLRELAVEQAAEGVVVRALHPVGSVDETGERESRATWPGEFRLLRLEDFS
jgi:hypothetical protein